MDAWSTKSRFSLGGAYTFLSDGQSLYVRTEYRRTGLRVPEALESSLIGDNDEVYVRLGILF